MLNSHFKTQQEIWKYVERGGSVINKIDNQIAKFIEGKINISTAFTKPEIWSPYIESIIQTYPTVFCHGNYYRKGNRVYIRGHGVPENLTIKHFTYKAETNNVYSYEVEGWSSLAETALPCGVKQFWPSKSKTKVWRWERLDLIEGRDGDLFLDCHDLTSNYFSEKYAVNHLHGYTKVESSEREI